MKIKKPTHISEKHVKHSACLSIILGTILEGAHIVYPSGLLLLGFGGIVALYEPYILHYFDDADHVEFEHESA